MAHLLVVDDDALNMHIVTSYLRLEGHSLVCAQDGVEACEKLSDTNVWFDAVVLDRVMPKMDGMEVLKWLRANPRFELLPVIMQTVAADDNEVAEGLAAGAWYYLAKPYRRRELAQIVKSALHDREQRIELARLNSNVSNVFGMIQNACFYFKTLEEISQLAMTLSQACPNEGAVAMGLSELMINAIEHGNLEISYADKSELMENGTWQEEVNHRLQQTKFQDRFAQISLSREAHAIRFTIRDMGKGFDWQKYLHFAPERAFDSHGRGIAMSKQIAFSTIEYRGIGNEVSVLLDLPAQS